MAAEKLTLRVVLQKYFALYMLSSCALTLNIFQLMVLPLWYVPFTLPVYRYISERTVGYYKTLFVTFTELWSGTKVIYTGDKVVKESTLMIANHLSYADWTIFYITAFRAGCLGLLRIFWKEAAKHLPGIGWAGHLHEYVPIRRSYETDAPRIQAFLESFVKFKSPIWLGMFPEGTFPDTTDKQSVQDIHVKTQEFAKKRGLKPLECVLTPRTKGFTLCVGALDGIIDSVLDLTIAYETNGVYTTDRGMPTLWQYFDQRFVPAIAVHVRRFPIKDVPKGEAAEKWLHKVYEEKDELLKGYGKTGKFPGQSRYEPLDKLQLYSHLAIWLAIQGGTSAMFYAVHPYMCYGISGFVVGMTGLIMTVAAWLQH
eukprot:GFYU01005616.1.p1 GENE.GFYU01005616.1~~GFYU01005616.1.p1  ORF type:complete len:369 (-),score=83.26 GFYU01005616.1:498-1604(-)